MITHLIALLVGFIAGALVMRKHKAKAIKLDALRAERAPKLEALDVAFMRAFEKADTAECARIAAQKQALRDVTKVTLPDELNALKDFKPDILK
jgi:hypothetical protein